LNETWRRTVWLETEATPLLSFWVQKGPQILSEVISSASTVLRLLPSEKSAKKESFTESQKVTDLLFF